MRLSTVLRRLRRIVAAGALAFLVFHGFRILRARGLGSPSGREEQFRLVAEKTSDLVCLHEPDGRYLYISPS